MIDRTVPTASGTASTADDRPHGAGPAALRLVVSPRAVLRFTVPVVLLLALASTVLRLVRGDDEELSGWMFYAVPLLDVDGEGGVPAWFSTLLLAACAAAVWTVADDVRAQRGRRHRYWRLLAFGFVYLSLDEAVTLHEQAGRKLGEAFELGGPLRFPWVVLAVPAVIVLGAVLVPFLRSLPAPTRRAFVACGALYVGGAVGLEMVGGAVIDSFGRQTVPYILVSTLEEVLEMLAAAGFLAAVGQHRRRFVVGAPGSRTT